MSEQAGKKYDHGKLRWDLLFETYIGASLASVARVVEFGASKYGQNNWQRVQGAKARYLAAAFRHIAARASGEITDKESGLPHLAHCATNCLFLMAFDRDLPEVEDTGPDAIPATELEEALKKFKGQASLVPVALGMCGTIEERAPINRVYREGSK